MHKPIRHMIHDGADYCFCSCSVVVAANKPNILMFVIDDLGWNDTSYQGSDIPTPTIDKFTKKGICLQQYYVQRICSPTRSAIMAGRYPYHMGLARKVIADGKPYGIPLNQTTIANELKRLRRLHHTLCMLENGILVCTNGSTPQHTEDLIAFMVITMLQGLF